MKVKCPHCEAENNVKIKCGKCEGSFGEIEYQAKSELFPISKKSATIVGVAVIAGAMISQSVEGLVEQKRFSPRVEYSVLSRCVGNSYYGNAEKN